MTDNEIVKALACCGDKNCKYCPNFSEDIECSEKLIKLSLDLINRQKAEIKRLKSMNQSKLDIIHDVRTDLETAKSEAIREFAERLKERTFECDVSQGYNRSCIMEVVSVIEIDYLASEMTEDNDAE